MTKEFFQGNRSRLYSQMKDNSLLALFSGAEVRKAGFMTGENICIDGGMTRQMICHNDFGWKLEE